MSKVLNIFFYLITWSLFSIIICSCSMRKYSLYSLENSWTFTSSPKLICQKCGAKINIANTNLNLQYTHVDGEANPCICIHLWQRLPAEENIKNYNFIVTNSSESIIIFQLVSLKKGESIPFSSDWSFMLDSPPSTWIAANQSISLHLNLMKFDDGGVLAIYTVPDFSEILFSTEQSSTPLYLVKASLADVISVFPPKNGKQVLNYSGNNGVDGSHSYQLYLERQESSPDKRQRVPK